MFCLQKATLAFCPWHRPTSLRPWGLHVSLRPEVALLPFSHGCLSSRSCLSSRAISSSGPLKLEPPAPLTSDIFFTLLITAQNNLIYLTVHLSPLEADGLFILFRFGFFPLILAMSPTPIIALALDRDSKYHQRTDGFFQHNQYFSSLQMNGLNKGILNPLESSY